MSGETGYRPSLGDRVGIIVFVVAGVVIVAWSAFTTISRIAQVAAGEPVPAAARFIGVEAEAPIGPDGALVPVQIDTAIVSASQLSTAGFGAAIIAPLISLATITAVVVCLILLARNSLRGRIFSRGNTHLVTAAGMTALVGFGVAPIFEGMVANDTIARLSERTFDDFAILTIEPLPFVLLAFAFGIVSTAYTIGARIQRETEGLV